jgi:AraC-like DNA-binding protein
MNIHQTNILSYKKKDVFQRMVVSHFDRVPKEFVENEACFVFVNQGEVLVRTTDQFFHLGDSSGILAKCMPFFYEKPKATYEQKIELVGVMLYPDIVEELFHFSAYISSFKLDYSQKKLIIDRQLQFFKDSILFLFDNPELAGEEMIGTKLKEFVLIISKIENAPSSLDFLSALFQPAVINFKKTVENNVFSNLSLAQFASLTNMSLSSFKRRFSEVFNDTPNHYINQKKIEKAKFKILSTEDSISQVAFDVGYDSLATFNRNFKKITGVSPTQFKLTQNA